MKHIRALSVDLDDTLWNNRPLLMAAGQEPYAWLGRHYRPIKARYSLAGMRSLRQDPLRQDPELHQGVTTLGRTLLRLVAESAGCACVRRTPRHPRWTAEPETGLHCFMARKTRIAEERPGNRNLRLLGQLVSFLRPYRAALAGALVALRTTSW